MIIYTNQKSKKKNKTKKQIAEYQAWLDSLNKQTTNFSRGVKVKTPKQSKLPKLGVPPGRETPHYPSLNTNLGSCTKPIQGKVYTGTAMKGIGTLHKSNAVPIFTDEEARDQANMRR
jgi:hypothetical protein